MIKKGDYIYDGVHGEQYGHIWEHPLDGSLQRYHTCIAAPIRYTGRGKPIQSIMAWLDDEGTVLNDTWDVPAECPFILEQATV